MVDGCYRAAASVEYRQLACRRGTQSPYQLGICVRGNICNCHALKPGLLACSPNTIEEKRKKESNGTFGSTVHFRGKVVKAIELVMRD